MIKNEKNGLNFIEIEVTGFQQICEKLKTLEDEKEQLKKDNKVLGNELTYFKEYTADLEEEINNLKQRCKKLAVENHDLSLENKDMRFTRKFLTAEEAGVALANEFLGKPLTESDIAEEEFIANGERAYALMGDEDL